MEEKEIQERGFDFEAVRRAVRTKKMKGRRKHVATQLIAGTYAIGKC